MNQSLVSCNDGTTDFLFFDKWNFFIQLAFCLIILFFVTSAFVLWFFTRKEKVIKSRGLYTPFYIFMVLINSLYFLLLTFINRERFYCALFPIFSVKFVTISLFIYCLESFRYFVALRTQELYSRPNYEQNLTFSGKTLIVLSKFFSSKLAIPLTSILYFFCYYLTMYIIVIIQWKGICDIRDQNFSLPLLIYDWCHFITLFCIRIAVILFDFIFFMREKTFTFKEYFIVDDPFYYRSQNLLILFTIPLIHLTTKILSVLPINWYCSYLELISPILSSSSHVCFLFLISFYPGGISIIKKLKGKKYKEEEFTKVISEEEYKTKFIQFLKNDLTIQYFMLYEEIQRFKSTQKKKQQAFIIFKNYIEEVGGLKVEISSKNHASLTQLFNDILEKKVKDVPEDIFDSLEREISEIIKESYMSFINTYDYDQITDEKSKLLKSLI